MEVESKALLSEEEYLNLSKVFAERKAELIIKKDYYYTQYKTLKKRISHNEPFIRVRIENTNTTYLTLKRKNIMGTKEYNDEQETMVSDYKTLETLLKQVGCWVYFSKEKWSQSLYDNIELNGKIFKVHCELETINNKYKYLEIECTGDIDKDIATQIIDKALKKYNISTSQLDSRDWPDILSNN